MGFAEFAGWLATQVFDIVGSVAGVQGADGGDTIHLQVGKTVFNDVPAKMRTELWLSQLHRKGAPPASEYYELVSKSMPQDVLAEIDKDTHRTFPGHSRLSTPAGHRSMFNVLRAYACSDPEIGYTQGMNFLAGLLLTYLPSEADSYAALSLLMFQRSLRELYLPDMALLQIRLWQMSKLMPPRLAAHMEAHAALPVLYASSWLLTCFAADFPLHFAARVMDVLMTGSHVASPLLKVAVGILQHCEAALLRMQDLEDIVRYLRQEVPQWSKRELHDMLTEALSKPWSTRQLRVLEQINGAETVMEAVTRVNNLANQSTSELAEVPTELPAELPAAPTLGLGLDLEPIGSSFVVAAASSSAVASAASAASTVGSLEQQQVQTVQQQQQQQAPPKPLSPRSLARSLSTSLKLNPLPAPPTSKAQQVAWGAWQATPALHSMASQAVRIEPSVVDCVELDPQLTRALSCYAPMAPAGTSHHAPRQAGQVAAAAVLEAAQGMQAGAAPAQQPQQAAAGGSTGDESPGWQAFVSSPQSPARGGSRSPQAMPPQSPFASCAPSLDPPPQQTSEDQQHQHRHEHQQQQQSPAPSLAAATSAASPDEQIGSASSFGSFQLGTLHSTLPLVDSAAQEQQQQQLVQQQGSPGAARHSGGQEDGGSPLQSFLGLFGRGSPASEQVSDGKGKAAGADPPHPGCGEELQYAATSHGSSLAAVLRQLGLAGHPFHGFMGSDNGSDSSSLTDSTTASSISLQLSTGVGGQLARGPNWASFKSAGTAGAGGVGGSGALPGAVSAQQAKAAAAAVAAAGEAQQSPVTSPSHQVQRSPRLSGAAATHRAAALQEEHLQGFLTSGKADVSKRHTWSG